MKRIKSALLITAMLPTAAAVYQTDGLGIGVDKNFVVPTCN